MSFHLVPESLTGVLTGVAHGFLLTLNSFEEPPAGNSLSVDGLEWVDLLVREVLTATNVEDARAHLSRALEALEKSICANATAEAAKSFQKVSERKSLALVKKLCKYLVCRNL